MALDVQELVREIVSSALPGDGDHAHAKGDNGHSSGGLHGMKAVAVGAGAAALAPIAFKGAGKLARSMGMEGMQQAVKSPGEALGGMASNVGDKVSSRAEGMVKDKVDEAGGVGGIAKSALKGLLPFGGGGGGGGGNGGVPGVGKGRRMPIQQAVDVGLPVETVYNQFTQFEDWPSFMHRVTNVDQEDDCTVRFSTKIWTRKREFKAKIETQRPDERIKWKVTEGLEHTGVVSFHELEPNLTRIILSFDVAPGGMIEKIARGARHIKRAARADLHRFSALIEMAEHETGAWRGVIEDGEVVEEHDPSYDEQREYSDIEEITGQDDSDDSDEEEDEDDSDEEADADESAEDEDGEEDGDEDTEDSSGRAARPQRRSSRGRSSQSSSSRSRSSQGGSSRSRSGQSGSSQRGSSGGRSRQSRSSSSNGSSGGGRTRSQRSS